MHDSSEKLKKSLNNVVLKNGKQEHCNAFGQFSCYFYPLFMCLLLVLFQRLAAKNAEIGLLEVPTIGSGTFEEIL